jgi:hypothetical protein
MPFGSINDCPVRDKISVEKILYNGIIRAVRYEI